MGPRRWKANTHWRLWAAACALLIALALYPVSTRLIRLSTVVLIGGVTSGFLFLTWRIPIVRWSLLLLAGFTAALIFGPARGDGDALNLRADYQRHLHAYEGVRYYWGGENLLGIDCSGLVRRAMVDALLSRGISTWNPGLIRKALLMWWNDTSALELRDNRHLTAELLQVQSVNTLDHSLIQPGDLVSNGTHIMAYIGDQRWIEADPGKERVIIVTAPAHNGWFQCPMTVLRWTHLVGSESP